MLTNDVTPSSQVNVVIGGTTSPQFEEDSLRLRELLHDVTTSLDGWFSNARSGRILDLLQALSHQVAVHFALEESSGLLAGSDMAVLELADLAAGLRAEHRALALEIESVVEQAETMVACAAESEPEQRRIVSRIRVFCHKLQRHERRENELLLQAYDEDIGVGD